MRWERDGELDRIDPAGCFPQSPVQGPADRLRSVRITGTCANPASLAARQRRSPAIIWHFRQVLHNNDGLDFMPSRSPIARAPTVRLHRSHGAAGSGWAKPVRPAGVGRHRQRSASGGMETDLQGAAPSGGGVQSLTERFSAVRFCSWVRISLRAECRPRPLRCRVVEENRFPVVGGLREPDASRDHGPEHLVLEEIPEIRRHPSRPDCPFPVIHAGRIPSSAGCAKDSARGRWYPSGPMMPSRARTPHWMGIRDRVGCHQRIEVEVERRRAVDKNVLIFIFDPGGGAGESIPGRLS